MHGGRSENRYGDAMVHSCVCGVVASTCSASDALSLSGLPKFVGRASRLASLTESCSPSCRLLLIVGTGSFPSEQSSPTQPSSQLWVGLGVRGEG